MNFSKSQMQPGLMYYDFKCWKMINLASFWGLSIYYIHQIVKNLTSPLPLVYKCMQLRTLSSMRVR